MVVKIVILGIKGLIVQDSQPAESLCCVLSEQDILSAA